MRNGGAILLGLALGLCAVAPASAEPLADSRDLYDLVVASQALMDQLVVAGGEPQQLADHLREQVHVPLAQRYNDFLAAGSRQPGTYTPFSACYLAALDLDGHENDTQYAASLGQTLPVLAPEHAYYKNLADCAAAIKSADKQVD